MKAMPSALYLRLRGLPPLVSLPLTPALPPDPIWRRGAVSFPPGHGVSVRTQFCRHTHIAEAGEEDCEQDIKVERGYINLFRKYLLYILY